MSAANTLVSIGEIELISTTVLPGFSPAAMPSALNIQAVSEALVFAAKAGADPAKVRAALMGGFASSRILEVHAERMLNGTFNPGFRIRLHQKDLNLALTAAKELSLSLPNTAIAQQMFSSCAAHGGADLDHSAMILAIEGLADHSIRPKK